jgi:hypothetical protein
MESEAERTLNNLHVLAALSHNDKLMSNEENFDIYTPTTFRGLFRTWYGEKRGQNVQRIRNTVRSAISFASRSLDETNVLLQQDFSPHGVVPSPESMMQLRVDTMALQHVRMVDALCSSRVGLLNLLQTYRDDAALASQITLIAQEITDFMSVIGPYSRPLRERCGVRSPSVPAPAPAAAPAAVPAPRDDHREPTEA